ncbi:Wadjet anti-phage system protein JetD domain-containing protein [Trinickia fusca]|uniref:DUF3322 and DUF2220 domain-containing protein n=1 Tax=Trinickia fusca TaxID=2419777 RepID=A0A494WXR8_9BURK|nr:Wadjet anti-phage system protein JetD domain-containing protein [Trinickia fusca]RKP43347.1 hypothetical protein D7S89_26455 [Trinickia fusca]
MKTSAKGVHMPMYELGGALMPDDVAQACKRQFERQQVDWLLRRSESTWPLSVALRSPSDKEAANAPAAMRTWLSAWTGFDNASRDKGRRCAVVWRSVNWRLMGNVTVPEKVLFEDIEAVADCARVDQDWETLKERWRALCERHASVTDKRDCAKALIGAAQWADDDFVRLLEFLGWCERNPASGLYLRQLPLVGIDTKWVERRLGVVVPLLQAIMGKLGDVHQLLVLRRAPYTVRMRLLDPVLREQMAGAEDLQMPVDQWSKLLRQPPKRLLIIENLATGLAVPDTPGTAVAMGLGNNVAVLNEVAWAHSAEILYWGDIDTWGLHILSRARSLFPHLNSMLMTETVLTSHRHLWTVEDSQDNRHADHLTAKEAELLSKLQQGRWGKHVRLEQERIHWPSAVEELSRRWGLL